MQLTTNPSTKQQGAHPPDGSWVDPEPTSDLSSPDPNAAASAREDEDTLVWPRSVFLASIVSMVITFAVAALIGLGPLACAVLSVAMVAALGGWHRTTYRARSDVRDSVALGVAVIVGLIGVVAEAYALEMSLWVGEFSERHFIIAAYSVFSVCIMGACTAWYRHPLGEYTMWLVFCLPLAMGAALLLGSVVGGTYVGGLASGVACSVLAGLGIRGLVRDWQGAASAETGGR